MVKIFMKSREGLAASFSSLIDTKVLCLLNWEFDRNQVPAHFDHSYCQTVILCQYYRSYCQRFIFQYKNYNYFIIYIEYRIYI